MNAKEELIAAALTVAGAVRWQYPELSDELREMCARAMVQPDVSEVERLLFTHESAVRRHAMGRGDGVVALSATRGALLDYVRDHFGDADKIVQPVSEVPMPEAIGRLYFGGVSCGELDEWEFDAYQGVCDRINESAITESLQSVYLHRDVRTYGDAREAAGYAAGVAAGVAALVALKPQSGVTPGGTAWLLPISRQDCVEAVAALRGEVK